MSEATQTILQTNTEAARETAGEADPGFLWDFWYPAVRSTEITGNKLVTAMLLEVPLVLGRTSDGRAFAMRDSCPHRGMPLSYGRFDGQAVECSYHGWRFDACTAGCVEIPSLTNQDKLKVERIFAGHFPCEERDGYIWVYMTSPDRRAIDNAPGARLPDAVPPAPALPVFNTNDNTNDSDKYKITHLSCELPSHIDHGIIGLMDPAHGPFVHQAWFWRSRHSIHEKEKNFEPIPNGFRMSKHEPSTNSAPYQLLKKMTGEPVTTTIDFVLPNQRLEEVHSGKLWFSSRATVTPVRRDICRIDFVAAWNIFLPVSLFRIFAKKFLRQDQETMIRQAEGLKHNPHLMLIDDADRPAKWYYALKANLIESRRTGAPMVHPMDGPVTLRWRS
ncbi:MAG TPA: Rieske 2Fe-2S domain-containing protein [Candidatus Acidoferrum sp.]|nr:Rieske 2Fe-2S domain-containing protein [Candidatus Acidoferrum sp.]